jgi:Putative endonuclease segE, GIY-YIG domain
MDLGHWIFPHEFDINEWFGFIYKIVEINTSREYIGKKQFFSNRTKAVKGRKNRKHYRKESDWRTYTGSSKELNLNIEQTGKENYQFFILSLHKTKGSLHYREVELQVKLDVLRTRLTNGTRKYYNGNISAVKFYPPDEHQDEIKMKI